MRGMTTPFTCPALTALRTIDMHTGQTRVVAVILGPRQAPGRPIIGSQVEVFDLMEFRLRRVQQQADLAVAQVAVQGDDGGR